jgi:hypothetical protein
MIALKLNASVSTSNCPEMGKPVDINRFIAGKEKFSPEKYWVNFLIT